LGFVGFLWWIEEDKKKMMKMEWVGWLQGGKRRWRLLRGGGEVKMKIRVNLRMD